MQLSKHGCLVARFLKKLREGHIGRVKRKVIVHLAIQVGKLSGQDRSSTWRTDGIGHGGIGKQHPHRGDPINIWSFYQVIAVSQNGLISMVIRHNKNDIRTLRLSRFLLAT